MEERHVLQLIQNLIDRFEYVGESEFNLNTELDLLTHPITRVPIDREIRNRIDLAFLTRIQYRRSHDGANLLPVSVVSDPRGHEEWYEEWLTTNDNAVGSYYWKRLENFLSHELSRKYGADSAGSVVRSIDDATSAIMSKLASPLRREFTYKGLVVGYVQSGKTANFTALISKAADAGYKLIIVLAGIHSVLRRQTQVRLDRELTGVRDIQGPDNYIELPGAAKTWNRLTTAHNDFTTANLGLFENYCRLETPTLAIVKKNVRVLDRLYEYFSEASIELRCNMPVLIIDDEADQASVDGNANLPDSDPTSTNERIRLILGLFSRRAYIGYTATPFANVLIDMTTEHGVLLDDLYPRNFIVSLPEPDGYFGTSMAFQGDLSERFIFEIPIEVNRQPYDETRVLIREGTMTNYLSKAIDEFVLCCAVRNLRGDRQKPMSMLIHVSHRINDMTTVSNIVSNEGRTPGYIQSIVGRYNSGNESSILKYHYQDTWNTFIQDAVAINEELGLSNELPNFELIWNELRNVFDVLRVIELNSSSEDTLDYTTGEEIKVIAIGGNQLSRGLTLEGLMTSYYLRASRQYDTLLQMGRWFGYRNGYEDLTRIHTTEQIWGFFEHLALVEAEIRSEIYRYEEEGLTPAEMAVAIRGHRNLSVTAPNKMGAGRPRQVSFSNSLNQTIWFPLNKPETLRANYNLGHSFIQRINSDFGFTNVGASGAFLCNGKVDGQTVLNNFLRRYNFVTRESTGGPGLDAENLLSYIQRRLTDQNSELNEWSVALVGNIHPVASGDPLTYGGIEINRIQRSRKHTERGFNVGVLTNPSDLRIDLYIDEVRSVQNPLLLLYLVWSGSEARTFLDSPKWDERIDLYRFINTEHLDVLGVAIALPESNFEPNNYIGQ